MLKRLALKNVGPADSMELDFGPRINVLTGDNGLGKSFLLDVAWWVMTYSWPSRPAAPFELNGSDSTIDAQFGTGFKAEWLSGKWSRPSQHWHPKPEELAQPEQVLAIYAQIDGSFALLDPAKSFRPNMDPLARPRYLGPQISRPMPFHFQSAAIWDGQSTDERAVINGLIRDVASWQQQNGEAFHQYCEVLKCLSPIGEELVPGKLSRISIDDVRDVPTIQMSYDQEVPVVFLSAGMKRVLCLAYLLVWLWQEHQIACKLLGREPAKQIVFLIDEIECHLHPRWQRVILNSLLNVMQTMTGSSGVEVQLICVTHSPLILASLEPLFDEDKDRLFHIQQEGTEVRVDNVPWAKQGDVTNWLMSDVFGLKQGRSLEAERAIEAAQAFMRDDLSALPKGLDTKDAIHQELVRTLPDHDDFWPCWVVTAKPIRRVTA